MEIEKKVDERWKEEVERERHRAGGEPRSTPAPGAPPPEPPPNRARQPAPPTEAEEPEGPGEPNFAMFLSSLSMQAMVALGELPLPGTNERHEDPTQARYLIDILGVLEQKTRGNLTAEEAQFLEGALYELRLRYAQKTIPPVPPPPGGRP